MSNRPHSIQEVCGRSLEEMLKGLRQRPCSVVGDAKATRELHVVTTPTELPRFVDQPSVLKSHRSYRVRRCLLVLELHTELSSISIRVIYANPFFFWHLLEGSDVHNSKTLAMTARSTAVGMATFSHPRYSLVGTFARHGRPEYSHLLRSPPSARLSRYRRRPDACCVCWAVRIIALTTAHASDGQGHPCRELPSPLYP
jgi:hypothetical protein